MNQPTQPTSCCNDAFLIDFSKMEIPSLEVDWKDVNLWVSMATIIFNPLYWNLVARWEYRTQGVSKIFHSRQLACILLGASIFALGIFRDMRYDRMMETQPHWYVLRTNWALWSGYGCMVVGMMLVLISFYQLGFYGTFLGDYFGILMEERVTSFPFNVLHNPMYWGSTLNFVGAALIKSSQAGLLLSLVVAVSYKIAIRFEGPFTAQIYEDYAQKTVRKQV